MLHPPPKDLEARVAWLVDRACIEDLLVEYARCVDDRDYDGWAALFVEDGRFVLPFGSVPQHRLAEFLPLSLAPYARTQHLQGNLAIELDGDHATVRRYLLSTHVLDAEEPTTHADVGGWFTITCRRVENGWRLVEVEAEFVWLGGEKFGPPPEFAFDPRPTRTP